MIQSLKETIHSIAPSSHCLGNKENIKYESCNPAASAAVPAKSCRGNSEGHFSEWRPVLANRSHCTIPCCFCSYCVPSVRPSVLSYCVSSQQPSSNQEEGLETSLFPPFRPLSNNHNNSVLSSLSTAHRLTRSLQLQ